MLRIQNEILRMIADGEALDETARRICASLEGALPGVICSILTVDRAGLMHPLAAPSLPDHYNASLDGMMIGPEVGSCGTAAYLREPVVAEDIARDQRFARLLHLLDGLDLKACWSFPVIEAAGDVVAVLAVYVREARRPARSERELIEGCVELCATALRRHERVVDRERRASIDALTGLPNRSALSAALANIRCDEPGSWALFVVDLDNLKIVNDTFGHLAGDALIRTAARRISRVMAPDVTFRLGGDEFAVIIQASGALADLDATAEMIFRELEAPAVCEGHSVIPRATIGGAVLGPSEPTAIAINEAADFALYHAKETGRGGFVRYWPGIGTRITHRRDAIRDVADALADGRIEAHYQPVVRLDTGEIVGLEALCRMRTPEGELISAAAFHEATTDAHVAAELTRHMVATVASDIVYWRDQGLPLQHVGLNVSTADFYTGSLARKLAEAFGRAGVPLGHLLLEVSEDVYIGRRDRVVAREIEALRAAGVQVALDDFGTGYASLTHLLNVPVDLIKTDPSFIARLWPDDPSMIIVEGLIEIARRLGICVVAEGIETEVQASQLWTMGCKLGQGFAFARAANREATAALLRLHGAGIEGATPLYAGRGVGLADASRAVAAQRRAAAG
ncbi:putative bifunctional diguanylate cyclase/phosphodiesterase [Paracoccus yeei]|uniref:GGDEF domain-containing protein n=2 Tax=Paracoccus yeei TaxID=147645 RepID=A0A386UGM9_9RHOB|nr:EAL domain-containing protein [Paracoccus yeei]AYE99772.1 GGDEF domain-containing protein [Paracoccus yeei]